MAAAQYIRARVPASTANLGPGFDSLGLALNLATTITVEPAAETRITITGENAGQLSCGVDNLVYRRMEQLAMLHGLALPPIHLQITNGIPLERGLGASSAASLGGLLTANVLLELGLDQAQILDLACQFEGHPDNVAPSLLGGCIVSVVADGHVTALHVPFPDDLVCVVCIPDIRMPTDASRQMIPQSYSRADAIFNLSRAALLVTALSTRQYGALRLAVQDRLHQPYRAAMLPALMPIIDAAQAAGAYGAFLSGAGSTIAAFAAQPTAAAVAQAMAEAGARHGLICRTLMTQVDQTGAVVDYGPNDG